MEGNRCGTPEKIRGETIMSPSKTAKEIEEEKIPAREVVESLLPPKPPLGKVPGIFAAMGAVASEVGPIAKDRKNTAQNYSFRGIDDVFNSVQPILAKHGIFTTSKIISISREERASKSGGIMAFVMMQLAFTFYAPDGSHVTTETAGEGMDSGDKATGKAMSTAMKYALLQTFQIPTADPKDVEPDNPDPTPKARPVAAPPTSSKPPVPLNEMRVSKATIEAIALGIEALKKLGQQESSIWDGMGKEVATKCAGIQFADLGELFEGEARVALDYLRRRYAHIHEGKKKAAETHAADGPPLEEYTP
jgi:hypothetical protein